MVRTREIVFCCYYYKRFLLFFTGEQTVPNTQTTQFIVVECVAYPTVTYNSTRPDCQLEFADHTLLHAMPDYSYHIEREDGGLLMIETDGTAVYFPRPDYAVPPRSDSEPHMQYIMRHFADDLLQTVDDEKNLFQVRADGFSGVLLASQSKEHQEKQASSEAALNSSESMQSPVGTDIMPNESVQVINLESKKGSISINKDAELASNKIVTYAKHAPRFFVINRDGSGLELMRYQDLSDSMAQAEDDPSVAVLMDPLPDQPNILGVSILKPYLQNTSQQWLMNYRQSSIMPTGLISRDWTTFPSAECKKPGPAFGTNVGRGVCVGAIPVPVAQNLPPKCPSVLEIRQVLQYLPSVKVRSRYVL